MMARINPETRFIINGDLLAPVEQIAGPYIYVNGDSFHVDDDRIARNTWRTDNATYELCDE